ncbi:MAG: bifunctional phosphoribosylaminoimidazolecarboxamide formyltransferase/IMP cyclohydrolase [Candidatus Marinimicrobia bacterium]|nr:bifunctional phosphoribosylaminoimidazolecarboxamide formyltransferase/IMP cyclohydrolase [Candidatus Neomarinimicrobiota bacterium]
MLTNPELNKKPVIVKRVLLSVFDKTGIVDFARALAEKNVEILSTGGTAKVLREANILVKDVSEVTGFPEIMDGRVKTINPIIEGGILGLRDLHSDDAASHNIPWIDLVVCNLYPFSETIQRQDVTDAVALENIDIGGPTMIRSAAKNVGWVGVIVDPSDYTIVAEEITQKGGLSFETRKKLSAKAFGHTAKYDAIIHNYFKDESLSEDLTLPFEKYDQLRYGENPHQKAAAYKVPGFLGFSVLDAKIHQGKKLSYNNIMDADGALACLREFSDPVCVVVKHANPCGVAIGNEGEMHDIYLRTFNADSLSAFGGIIAMNRTCTASVAEEISKVFVEIVIAPDFEKNALDILAKKKNLRVLETGSVPPRDALQEYRYVVGGLLVQDTDTKTINRHDLDIVTKMKPSDEQIETMLFAWKVLKHVKSNGILIAQEGLTVGIGPGQVSRVDATDIAIKKADELAINGVLASDAFFPFRDSIDKIAPSGVKAIIQPGGSIRDKEVIEACNEHGIAMVFTGGRCFKH